MKALCGPLPEGCVVPAPDAPFGFTPDLFAGYLTRKGSAVYVSLVTSLQPGRGNLSRLFDAIQVEGLTVKVPCPIGRMPAILKRKGFRQTWEWSNEAHEPVDVWVRP